MPEKIKEHFIAWLCFLGFIVCVFIFQALYPIFISFIIFVIAINFLNENIFHIQIEKPKTKIGIILYFLGLTLYWILLLIFSYFFCIWIASSYPRIYYYWFNIHPGNY